MNNHLVSVIIPCYNAEQHIDHSIRSVYDQDYPFIELIVVDDGSTDSSLEKILSWTKRFSEKGYTLKSVHQNNRGLGGAIDTALKYVEGTYLTLLDADDIYLPGAIRKKALFLDTNPGYAGVRNNGWFVQGSNRTLFIQTEEERNITDLFSALTYGKTNNWAGTYMVRTSILFKAYPDRNINPSRFGQNFQILLPVSYRQKFGYIDEPLMEYHIQKNSLSQINDLDQRYLLGERNSAGWREIYNQIVSDIVQDEKERQTYLNAYSSVYYRGGLHRAAANNRLDDFIAYYHALVSTKLSTLNDHIFYYSVRRSPLVIPLKVLRRLRMCLSYVKGGFSHA